MKKILLPVLLGVCLTLLSSCADNERHYWQRTDPNSAIYLTGVKAQQELEQDISECVHTIIELTKLSDVRGHVPSATQALGDHDQKQETDDMSKLPLYDVPEYIRNLRVDHTDYHDFDGCMVYKGWSRVRYVGPEEEKRSKEIYDDTANYSVRPKNPATMDTNNEMNELHKDR
jgi:hypothetical protein